MQLEYVQYKLGGCLSEVEEQTDTRPAIQFAPAMMDIADISMAASQEVVGASGTVTENGVSNAVDITFKPKTMLDQNKGSIKVFSQPNFKSLKNPIYVHDDNEFSCSSEQLYGTETEADSSQAFFLVKYKFLVPQPEQAGPPTIVLNCRNWWNPVSPQIMKGFRIKTYDKYDKKIDQTDDRDQAFISPQLVAAGTVVTFALDATAFRPFPI